MKSLIISDSKQLNQSIHRYLKFVLGLYDINQIKLSEYSLSKQILQYDLYIIFGFSLDDYKNPEGWRVAKKIIAGQNNKKMLILFTDPLIDIPDEGPFWVDLLGEVKLSEKIRDIIDTPAPQIADFEKIENKFPELKYKPESHH